MWTLLNDCGKQISLHASLRQKTGEDIKLYEVEEIEFDQYHVHLKKINDIPAQEEEVLVFSCTQLVEYGFEIEMDDDGTIAS